MSTTHPLRQIARHVPGVRPLFRWIRGVRESRRYRGRETGEVFTDIHRRNAWGNDESVSGAGSSHAATEALATTLPEIAHRLGVHRVLDIPCGDYHWMRDVDWRNVHYTGADIVPELIERNRSFADDTHEFRVLDLLSDPLPDVDLILCRDCLVHFSNDDVRRALTTIAASSARFVLMTTFPRCETNRDIVTGHWRPLNLEAAPFHLPPPRDRILEAAPDLEPDHADKSLALWRVDDLRT